MVTYGAGDLLAANNEALVKQRQLRRGHVPGDRARTQAQVPGQLQGVQASVYLGEVRPARMFVFKMGELISRYIMNFPTTRHWRGRAGLDDIEAGLSALVTEVEHRRVRSIARPPLRCGLGGLDWRVVKQLMHVALSRLADVDAVVFESRSHSGSVSTETVSVER